LAEAIDRVFKQLEFDVEARFHQQNRSVEALQTMVGQTDVLLQKVLDGLESIKKERGEPAPGIDPKDGSTFAGLSNGLAGIKS